MGLRLPGGGRSVTPMDVLLCFHSPSALCDLLFPNVWLCHYVQVCLIIILIYIPHISCIQFSGSSSVLVDVYMFAAFLLWITLMWIIKDCWSLFFFFVHSLLHHTVTIIYIRLFLSILLLNTFLTYSLSLIIIKCGTFLTGWRSEGEWTDLLYFTEIDLFSLALSTAVWLHYMQKDTEGSFQSRVV